MERAFDPTESRPIRKAEMITGDKQPMRVKDLLNKIVSVHFIKIELYARYRVFGELTETNIRMWECNANLMRKFDEDDRWLLSEEVDGIIIVDTTLCIYIRGEVSEC